MNKWNPIRRKVELCLGCEDFVYQEWHRNDDRVDRCLVCNFIKVDVSPQFFRKATREDVDSLPEEGEVFETRLVPLGCEREPYPTLRRLREL